MAATTWIALVLTSDEEYPVGVRSFVAGCARRIA